MTRLDLLNLIAAVTRAKTYLEVGVQGGLVFKLVNVPNRVGVDPDPRSAATVHQTSDDYFAALDPSVKFDLIFIDGLHLAEQVERDAANALSHLSEDGVIVFHDCDPPNEQAGQRDMCAGYWCGDTWKAWLKVRAVNDRQTLTVDTDLGLGVILPITVGRVADQSCHLLSDLSWLDQPGAWSTFQQNRSALLNLVSPTAARTWINRLARRR